MSAPSPSTIPAPPVSLQLPRNDPFTLAQLAQYSGYNGAPIFVSVKGVVFDVTPRRDTYGPGASYHVFAGKDPSRGLGLSSVRPEDAVPDYSGLNSQQLKVLDDWYNLFSKKYNIVGLVSDHPVRR